MAGNRSRGHGRDTLATIRQKSRLAAFVVVMVGSAGLVHAGLSIISSSRVLQCVGTVTENGNQVASDDSLINGPSTGPWSDFTGASASYGGGSGGGSASQTSDITTNGITFSARTDTAGSGYETQIVDDEGNPILLIGDGSGTAYADLRMRFEITTTGMWRLEGTSSGSNGGSAQVVITDSGGNVISAIGDGTQDHQFELPTGIYDIWMFANASVTASGTNFSECHGEFTGSFTAVPSPMTLPLLGLCAAIVRRRR